MIEDRGNLIFKDSWQKLSLPGVLSIASVEPGTIQCTYSETLKVSLNDGKREARAVLPCFLEIQCSRDSKNLHWVKSCGYSRAKIPLALVRRSELQVFGFWGAFNCTGFNAGGLSWC